MLPSSPDGRMIDILIWTFEIEATNKNVPSIHRYGFGWCLHIESWDHQCRCCHLRQDPSMGYHGCVEVCDTDRCRWILCVRHIVVPCMGCWLLYCLGSVPRVWGADQPYKVRCACGGSKLLSAGVLFVLRTCAMWITAQLILLGQSPMLGEQRRIWWLPLMPPATSCTKCVCRCLCLYLCVCVFLVCLCSSPY